jgi:hypothetical protein
MWQRSLIVQLLADLAQLIGTHLARFQQPLQPRCLRLKEV